jgi:hypothetical protein
MRRDPLTAGGNDGPLMFRLAALSGEFSAAGFDSVTVLRDLSQSCEAVYGHLAG